MNEKIRKVQKEILNVFSRYAEDFALSGGTALELYYLHHRFSADLDFFSPKYNLEEIDRLIQKFEKCCAGKLKLESELFVEGKARVRFYTAPIKDTSRPLKIDFVEDVIFDNPNIENFEGIRVYGIKNIYLQKIIAVTGTQPEIDYIGRELMTGRKEARDIFDIYILSKKIKSLHIFLQDSSAYIQRGMVQWYRRFSRTELKLALLDLDIYDKKFDSKKMIIYLEDEIKKFMRGVLE